VVCERWTMPIEGFWNFVKDMGERPEGYSLDRIDPDGGWCEADLSGSQQGRDLHEAITNGLIDDGQTDLLRIITLEELPPLCKWR